MTMARLQNGPSAPFFWSHKTLGPLATGAGASCWREWAVIEVACWRQKKKKDKKNVGCGHDYGLQRG